MKFFCNPLVLVKETSLVERFLSYIKIDTTSDDDVERCPSSEGQFELARQLVQELKDLGLGDAAVDGNCYVTATLPGNSGAARVGLIAHLDTSAAASGKNISAVFHENYDGKPIHLKNDVVIDPAACKEIERCIGDTIITSDGTTLLGADDKAGIAIIMAALQYYRAYPDTPHPTIRIGFTPDEEIGRGAHKFPIERFNADVAFTLDGSFDGEVNIETFNANSATVTMTGVSTHPGTAKGKMVNALRHMSRFIDGLPVEISPENTEGRQGFIHPLELKGDASECRCHLILRDFEEDKLAELDDVVKAVAASIAKDEPRLKVNVEIKHSYPNMYKYLKDKPEIVERLKQAVEKSGTEPDLSPIRGGTDGANLTSMGLPCPNLFTGGVNFHSQAEWISTRSMGLALCAVLNLMSLYAE